MPLPLIFSPPLSPCCMPENNVIADSRQRLIALAIADAAAADIHEALYFDTPLRRLPPACQPRGAPDAARCVRFARPRRTQQMPV